MKPYAEWRYDVEKILDAGVSRVVATLHQRGKPARAATRGSKCHYGIVYTVEKEGLIRRSEFYLEPRKPSKPWGCRSKTLIGEPPLADCRK